MADAHTDTTRLAWVECDPGRFVAAADGGGYYEIHLASDAFRADAHWRYSHLSEPEIVYTGSNLADAKLACEADMTARARKLAWNHYMAAHDPPVPTPNMCAADSCGGPSGMRMCSVIIETPEDD